MNPEVSWTCLKKLKRYFVCLSSIFFYINKTCQRLTIESQFYTRITKIYLFLNHEISIEININKINVFRT